MGQRGCRAGLVAQALVPRQVMQQRGRGAHPGFALTPERTVQRPHAAGVAVGRWLTRAFASSRDFHQIRTGDQGVGTGGLQPVEHRFDVFALEPFRHHGDAKDGRGQGVRDHAH